MKMHAGETEDFRPAFVPLVESLSTEQVVAGWIESAGVNGLVLGTLENGKVVVVAHRPTLIPWSSKQELDESRDELAEVLETGAEENELFYDDIYSPLGSFQDDERFVVGQTEEAVQRAALTIRGEQP